MAPKELIRLPPVQCVRKRARHGTVGIHPGKLLQVTRKTRAWNPLELIPYADHRGQRRDRSMEPSAPSTGQPQRHQLACLERGGNGPHVARPDDRYDPGVRLSSLSSPRYRQRSVGGVAWGWNRRNSSPSPAVQTDAVRAWNLRNSSSVYRPLPVSQSNVIWCA